MLYFEKTSDTTLSGSYISPKQHFDNIKDLRRLPTVQNIFEHLGNTSALTNMSYFFQLDMKI